MTPAGDRGAVGAGPAGTAEQSPGAGRADEGSWLTRLVAAQRSVAEAGPGSGEVVSVLAEAGHRLMPGHVVVSVFEGQQLVAGAISGVGGGVKVGDALVLEGTLVGLCARSGETTLCLDIDWVVGSCVDVSGDQPQRTECGPGGVQVISILPDTVNVNACPSADRGFVYDERRFVVCIGDR